MMRWRILPQLLLQKPDSQYGVKIALLSLAVLMQWTESEQVLGQQTGQVTISDEQSTQTLETQTSSPMPSEEFRQRYRMANEAAQAGNWSEAIKHFSSALKLEPQNAQTHYLLSLALLKAGQPQPAWFHARQAVRLDLNNPEASAHFASLWARFDQEGLFNVGKKVDPLLQLLGQPDQQYSNGSRQQLIYGYYAINFVDGKVFSIVDLRQMQGSKQPASDVVVFQLPDQDWTLNYRMMNASFANSEYTKSNETVQNWTELFSTRRAIGQLSRSTLEQYVGQMEALLRRTAAKGQFQWKVHRKEDKRIFYEWSLQGVAGQENQTELAVCFAGESDIHTVAYANRSVPLDQQVRQKWIDVLSESRLLTSEQYQQMISQHNSPSDSQMAEQNSEKPNSFQQLSAETQLRICRETIARHLAAFEQQNMQQLRELFTPRLQQVIDQAMVEQAAPALKGITPEMLIESVAIVQTSPEVHIEAKLPRGRTLTTFILQEGELLADTIWFR